MERMENHIEIEGTAVEGPAPVTAPPSPLRIPMSRPMTPQDTPMSRPVSPENGVLSRSQTPELAPLPSSPGPLTIVVPSVLHPSDPSTSSESSDAAVGAKKRKPLKTNKLQPYIEENELVHNDPDRMDGGPVTDWKCPLCGEDLTSLKEFTVHLRSHNEVKPTPDPSDPTGQAKVYYCCLCGKMLSSFSSLDRHMLVHSGERPFSCVVCGQTFTTNGNMHRHARTHGIKGPCSVGSSPEGTNPGVRILTPGKRPRKRPPGPVQDRGQSPISVDNVSKELVYPQKVQCPVCNEVFFSDGTLDSHIVSSHPNQQLKCDFCPTQTPNYQSLKLHKYLHHFQSIPISFNQLASPFASREDRENIRPGYLGDDNRSMSPDLNEVSENEIMSPMAPRSQLVDALTRPQPPKDKDLADVQSILRIAHNFSGIPQEQNTSNNCIEERMHESIASIESEETEDNSSSAICDQSNDDIITSPVKKLRLDQDTWEDVQSDDPLIKEMKLKGEFPCSLCTSVFPNLRALKGHNKEHLGKAPYRCNVGQCIYASNDKSTLTRHMRRHTGEKPFECNICNYGFTTKANCERHLKNKHQKVTREQIRDSIIIHETENTDSMLARMQIQGDVTLHSQSPQQSISDETNDIDSDSAFRCKVCKFTFMSKFAVIQHGIHSHPEYAKDIEHIAEVVCDNPKRSETPPEIVVTPRMDKIRPKMQNIYPYSMSTLDHEVPNNDIEEEYDAPLDLSQSNSNDEGLDLSFKKEKDSEDQKTEPVSRITIPKEGFPLGNGFLPPSFPYAMMPGGHPLAALLFPSLAMSPMMTNASKDREEFHREMRQRLQLQAGGGYFNPSLPVGPMDIAAYMAAQDNARKQAEFKQQQEAAETLQNLSKVQSYNKQPKQQDDVIHLEDGREESNAQSLNKQTKEDESMFKMVIKNGVLMKKQKQRRYRTERPYSCQSCNARFTLRSNMERHMKQQHPENWNGKPRTGRRSMSTSVPTLNPDMQEQINNGNETDGGEKEETFVDTDNEREEDGELVIDDQPNESKKDDETPADLASVSNLLNNARNHTFQQYFTNNGNESQEDENEVGSESHASGSELDSREASEQKKSAYSSAPHKISCPVCARKFPWESSLKRHILTHTGHKPFKCRECPLWFTTKSNCDRHMLRKHSSHVDPAYSTRLAPERPYKCSLCPSSTFSSESNLSKHRCEKHLNMEYPNGNEEGMEIGIDGDDYDDENQGVINNYYKCHLCDDDFIYKDHAIAHIEHEHQKEYLENKDIYNENISRLPSDETHQSRLQEATNNNDIESGDGSRRVNCLFCSLQFSSAEELCLHVPFHTKNKPFSCNICCKKFSIEGAMVRHKKKCDSGVSSSGENSEDEAPSHYTEDGSSPRGRIPSHYTEDGSSPRGRIEDGSSPGERSSPELDHRPKQTQIPSMESKVTKRANLMDKINRLSAAKAAVVTEVKPRSTLDQIFSSPKEVM